MSEKILYLNGLLNDDPVLGIKALTLDEVYEASINKWLIEIDKNIKIDNLFIEDKINTDREFLEKFLIEHPEKKIYGTNRLHGDLKYVDVSYEKLKDYQKKYIKVHNCGTGKALPPEIVRAIMIIRLNSFIKCKSGISFTVIKLMIDMLNKDIIPWVLEEGSVGASGDLVPLAMIAASMIGLPESKVYVNDVLIEADDPFYSNLNFTSEVLNSLDPEVQNSVVSKILLYNGLKPVELGAKEAMGLTNGSNFLTALAIFAYKKAANLLNVSTVSVALSLEAIRGEKNAFSKIINENRPHEGQLFISEQIRLLTSDSNRMSVYSQLDLFIDKEKDPNDFKTKIKKIKRDIDDLIEVISEIQDGNVQSELIDICEKSKDLLEQRSIYEARKLISNNLKISVRSHFLSGSINSDQKNKIEKEIFYVQRCFPYDERVQDRYSFRAAPPVHGAAFESLKKLKEVIEIEIRSVTDNPLFIIEEDVLEAYSGANFHGQPLAAVIDYVSTTVTALGLISDKRSFSMLDASLSYGLPADLAENVSDADGGLMITQYAGAGRAAESKILSTPASITSVSTSANQEDFVSMGSIGVINLLKIIENIEKILAIELLCATRAIQITYNNLPCDILVENNKIDLRKLGTGTSAAYNFLVNILGNDTGDRYLRNDIEALISVVKEANLIKSVKNALPQFNCL